MSLVGKAAFHGACYASLGASLCTGSGLKSRRSGGPAKESIAFEIRNGGCLVDGGNLCSNPASGPVLNPDCSPVVTATLMGYTACLRLPPAQYLMALGMLSNDCNDGIG